MYSLSTVVESQVWDNLQAMLKEIHADERIVPCGVIHEGEKQIIFNNTFELLKAIQERIELKRKMIRFSLYNIDFETNKIILTIKSYVLSYKG